MGIDYSWLKITALAEFIWDLDEGFDDHLITAYQGTHSSLWHFEIIFTLETEFLLHPSPSK